jgi:hypothetical protein
VRGANEFYCATCDKLVDLGRSHTRCPHCLGTDLHDSEPNPSRGYSEFAGEDADREMGLSPYLPNIGNK